MSASPRRAAWGLLALLVASNFINYIDRGNLPVAAPVLSADLGLQPEALGNLLGAFFWTYALFQLFGIAGWLADRFNVSLVLAAGFFLWSASTALTGLVSGIAGLFAARLMLGVGESLAYPCYSRIFAEHVPPEQRGLGNALVDAAAKVGPALGTYLGGMLLLWLGWRWFFIGMGLASLLWLIPWLIWMPPAAPAARRHDGPGVAAILGQRAAWGTFAALFCSNYFWYFLLSWLPTYLVNERHFALERMARIGAAAYLVMATATVITGWLSDRLIARGAPLGRVRKAVVVIGLTGSTVILPVAAVEDPTLSITLLMLACISFGIFASNLWAITQTLAGPQASGRWTSLQNGVGNLAGIAAASVTGWVVQTTGSFHMAFATAAAVALTGALVWLFVVGPIAPVRWSLPSAGS